MEVEVEQQQQQQQQQQHRCCVLWMSAVPQQRCFRERT